MSDNDKRKFTGLQIAKRNDDGSYEKVEPIELNFHFSEPCLERADEQTIAELTPKVSFTFELSPPMMLQFYRVVYPKLAAWFGDRVN